MGKELNSMLFKKLSQIIEQGKLQVVSRVNSILTITYWQIGKKINDYILKNERAEYGGKVVINLAKDLEK